MQNEKPRPSLSMFATMDDYKKALAEHGAVSQANAVGGSISDDREFMRLVSNFGHASPGEQSEEAYEELATWLDSLLAGSKAGNPAMAYMVKRPSDGHVFGIYASRADAESTAKWDATNIIIPLGEIEPQDGLVAPPSRGTDSQPSAHSTALPNGWFARIKDENTIIVQHKEIGGAVVRKDDSDVRASIFYEFVASVLVAEPASQQDAGGWISVKDRLPELHKVVALLNDDRWMNTGGDFDINWHGAGWLCKHSQEYWSVIGESRGMTLESVTHWQYLAPVSPTPSTTTGEPQ